VSARQPHEHQVDHGEVHRREQHDVAPAGPTSGPFSLMTGIMFAVVIIAGIWFLATMFS
jgi:hypothetical protein